MSSSKQGQLSHLPQTSSIQPSARSLSDLHPRDIHPSGRQQLSDTSSDQALGTLHCNVQPSDNSNSTTSHNRRQTQTIRPPGILQAMPADHPPPKFPTTAGRQRSSNVNISNADDQFQRTGEKAKQHILNLENELIRNIYYLTSPQAKRGLSSVIYKGKKKPTVSSHSYRRITLTPQLGGIFDRYIHTTAENIFLKVQSSDQ